MCIHIKITKNIINNELWKFISECKCSSVIYIYKVHNWTLEHHKYICTSLRVVMFKELDFLWCSRRLFIILATKVLVVRYRIVHVACSFELINYWYIIDSYNWRRLKVLFDGRFGIMKCDRTSIRINVSGLYIRKDTQLQIGRKRGRQEGGTRKRNRKTYLR